MVSHKAAVLSVAILLAGSPASPADRPPDDEPYRVLTFRSSSDASDQPFALYTPAQTRQGELYPLILSLHGAGQTHREGLRQVFGAPAGKALSAKGYFIAAPFGRGSMGYEGIAERDVLDTLEYVQRRFPVDPDRVYLTGVSMGGSGTLSIALRYPDRWAAVAVVCGGAPAGSPELAPNLGNTPVHLFHGDRDTVVPVETGRRWRDLFQAAGVDVTYREFAGEGHNIAPLAYKSGYIFEWFKRHKRHRTPSKILFNTHGHAWNRSYWLRIDSFPAGKLARVDAAFANDGLTIATENTDSLTIDTARVQPQSIIIDGTRLKSPADRPIHLAWHDGTWRIAASAVMGGKRPGLDGPISSVMASKHTYVYGTLSADAPELWRRAETAQRAADWSGRRARPAVNFPVLPDEEAAAIAVPLVLFGTASTNRLVRDWSPVLPIALKPESSSEYGLVFVTPVNGRLVLVSSGLPWWTSPSPEQQQSFRWQWLSVAYRLASQLPDFVLFHRSPANVVASGYFTKDWALDETSRAALLASGVVSIAASRD